MKIQELRKIKLELSGIKPTEVVKKDFNIAANDFADYPWEQCIADQTKAYGSKEIAAAVCGKIKAENSSKQEMDILPNPCYKGYEPIGLKDDGSPNCVPIKKK